MSFGLLKTGLVDFPGRVAATIFFSGCNLRCPWCHNRELVSASPPSGAVTIGELEEFLVKRRGVLGGVCLTGGEPLLSSRIYDIVELLHEVGLDWKLDSNGTLPLQLEKLLERFHHHLPALIAFDYKVPLQEYQARLSPRTKITGEELFDSIQVASRFAIPYELRSTFSESIFSLQELKGMAALLADRIEGKDVKKAKKESWSKPLRWSIQPFRPGTCLDPQWNSTSPPGESAIKEAREIITALLW